MLAAEAAFKVLSEGAEMELYWGSLKKSWIWEELHQARNYRPVNSASYNRLLLLLYCFINVSIFTLFLEAL